MSQSSNSSSNNNVKHSISSLKQKIDELENQVKSFETENLMFQGLLETIPDNVYFKDRESRFTCLSKAMVYFFKTKNGINEVLGKTDFDMFTGEHAQDAFNDEQHIMDTGKTSYQ